VQLKLQDTTMKMARLDGAMKSHKKLFLAVASAALLFEPAAHQRLHFLAK